MPKLSIIEFLASRGSTDNLHKIGIKSKDKLADSLLKAHKERLRQRKNKRSLEWYYSNLEENRKQASLRQKQRRENNLEREQKKRKKYHLNLDPEQ